MTVWLGPAPLVLASRSAARGALLEAAGIPIELHPADIDERALEAETVTRDPGASAVLLAQEKARAVARSRPGRLVLGADQILALGPKRFSKPADRFAARAQLKALRGHIHELHVGLAFVEDGAAVFAHVETARLTMRPFSDDFLDHYLDAMGDAVLASVGCYQLEGLGIQLFERIDGDYFTILGLPLLQALDFLRGRGYLVR